MNTPILISTDPGETLALQQALPSLRLCVDVHSLTREEDLLDTCIFLGVELLQGDLRKLGVELGSAAPHGRFVALLGLDGNCCPEKIAAAGFHAMLPLPVHGPLARFFMRGGHPGDGKRPARVALAMELQGAWDRGELCLHYQPRCDAETRQVRGFEALVRWEHPTRGLLPPGEFISMAEETGMIIDIGAWVLREACAQVAAWDSVGLPPVQIAVNLSPVQFTGEGPLEVVQEALQSSGLSASRLELEITESLMLEDPDGVILDLERLKALGVQLAIDDFGTGYSSLSYLRRFPVDTLKIDKCFVDDLASDPGDAAIVTSIVVLGQSLGLSIVAEGVENERQLEFLRVLGVDEIQGYLLSKPLPVDEIPSFLCISEVAGQAAGTTQDSPKLPVSPRVEPTG
ncbi:MAG TPA: EAL domain-containing protein [Planctomycetes bacterium]|nr:EAL domain-containing protein [Planctomycetota bacterium]HIL37863.1 EAL domain-containing protein [Planctomycetota bacterium]